MSKGARMKKENVNENILFKQINTTANVNYCSLISSVYLFMKQSLQKDFISITNQMFSDFPVHAIISLNSKHC